MDSGAAQQVAMFEGWVRGEWGSQAEPYGVREWFNPAGSAVGQEVLAAIERHIQPGAAVLEIGPGGGRWTRFLVQRQLDSLYLIDGTDAGFGVLAQVIGRAPVCGMWVSPDGRIPWLQDEELDAVFSFDTFVHFGAELRQAYVAEIGRVLRPGGVALLHWARPTDTPGSGFVPVPITEEVGYYETVGALVEVYDVPIGPPARFAVLRKAD